MSIGFNLHCIKKNVFVPKEPIRIEITAERRAASHSILIHHYK